MKANGTEKLGDVCEVEFVDEGKVKKVRAAMKSAEVMTALAETYKVLGDPTRLKIAYALSREELCVCDIANLLGVSQSAVSHSLRTLRQMNLVRSQKIGKTVHYSLVDEHIIHLLETGFEHVEESV